MGLDTTHDCWHGAYSAFMRWRCEIAKAAGLPPLQWMEGFYRWSDINHNEAAAAVKELGFSPEHSWASELLSGLYNSACLPIRWDSLKPTPLRVLLDHSDCDGEIESEVCADLADALEELLPKLPEEDDPGHIGNWRNKTQQFIDGLRLAAENGENVGFH